VDELKFELQAGALICNLYVLEVLKLVSVRLIVVGCPIAKATMVIEG
jgi:hypothetical protein